MTLPHQFYKNAKFLVSGEMEYSGQGCGSFWVRKIVMKDGTEYHVSYKEGSDSNNDWNPWYLINLFSEIFGDDVFYVEGITGIYSCRVNCGFIEHERYKYQPRRYYNSPRGGGLGLGDETEDLYEALRDGIKWYSYFEEDGDTEVTWRKGEGITKRVV